MWFLRLLQEQWPPRSQFATSDIPDLTGKVAIVTGANTGMYTFLCITLYVQHNLSTGRQVWAKRQLEYVLRGYPMI